MSVRLSIPLLNDELIWIRRLEELRRKKLFTIWQFEFRYFQYTVRYAAENDREYGPALCWFLNLPAPGHNNFVGNRRQRQCGAPGSADDQCRTARFGKDCARRFARRRNEMRWYQDLSIPIKLRAIVMITCGAALVVAAVLFTLYDRATFLLEKTPDLIASAKMIGSNSAAALSFHDTRLAREVLNALQAKQHVVNACIYDSDGTVFAKYSRSPTHVDFPPSTGQKDGTTIVARHMILFKNIVAHGDSIGTIYIEADLGDLNDRLLRFVMIDFIVLAGSLAVVFVLSHRLQRLISEPIRELAETAATFSANENYSMRATKRSKDEIGVLVDQFNGMLDRLQQRDVSLQQAHEGLEKSVAERTSYLNALIENSPLGILVLDSARLVKLCNPAFERLFQYTRLEVVGKAIDGLIVDGDLLPEGREIYPRTLDGEVINLMTQRGREGDSV